MWGEANETEPVGASYEGFRPTSEYVFLFIFVCLFVYFYCFFKWLVGFIWIF
eukprot:gene7829-5460_t